MYELVFVSHHFVHGPYVLVPGASVCSLPSLIDLLTLPAVTPSGAKLEAVQTLRILPGHIATSAAAQDPRTAQYQLQARTGDRSEIIFLRHGDVISEPDAPGTST